MAVAENEESFIWIISNNKLIQIKDNIVLDNEFYIFHNYDSISIKYYRENETYFQRNNQMGKMLKLTLHDGAILEVKHDNEVILKTITHKATFTNVLKYNAGIKFQNISISILLAFISAILGNVAYYYNLERRII